MTITMTNAQKLLICIAEANGPIRTAELEKKTGIPAKNHAATLATAVVRGLVNRCDVINERGRRVSEYRIGAAYTPANAEKALATPPSVIKADDGRPLLRDAKELEQASAHHHAQPEVAQNTGRDGSETPPYEIPPAEAVAPIEYTPASARTVQELANALDKINELKQRIAELERRSNYLTAPTPDVMVSILQGQMTNGISLIICEKNIWLEDMDQREYKIDPHEYTKALDALKFVQERMAA